MGEEKKHFRFLSLDEFILLPGKDRAAYLSMASQELEERQRTLREQKQRFLSEPKTG